MAAATATAASKSSKSVDPSLWWDSFVDLFEDLDRAAAPAEHAAVDRDDDSLVNRLRQHRLWFLESVRGFKQPNEVSRLALESDEVAIGSRRLVVKPELKEGALRTSQLIGLDEVQSYILVERASIFSSVDNKMFSYLVMLYYFLERQCLLKCTRRLYVHSGDDSLSSVSIREEALTLVNKGLEKSLIYVVECLLEAAFSVKSEFEITVLWVDETLIEITLVFDTLFLVFYDSFSICKGNQWRSLCSLLNAMLSGSYDVGRFATSDKARQLFDHAKVQLLLILIETLDLENILRVVSEEVSISQEFSSFTLSDIQEMDAEVSKLCELGTMETGTLALAWATFLCLVLSLPESSDCLIMDLDHTRYARRAFESSLFHFMHNILCSDILRDSDGPVSGFVSVLRTLISACIASYELFSQTDNNVVKYMSRLLRQIYSGEEQLCVQFWDKNSFVDGPIRSLLYALEKEYPFQKVEFICFLSSVCEGAWPAECVYKYLEKMSGITTLYEVTGATNYLCEQAFVETHNELKVHGVEGFIIPSHTRGYVVRVINESRALVRWEYHHSGILVLLLFLAEDIHAYNYEEACHIVDLFCRMVLSNKALCFKFLDISKPHSQQSGMNRPWPLEQNLRVDIVKLMCTSIVNLIQDAKSMALVSSSFSLLAVILNCSPFFVFEAACESNIFATSVSSPRNASGDSWFLSNDLARLIFAACEENDDCSILTNSVLDFTIQVVRRGAPDDVAISLAVFCLKYIFINHLNWKYKKQSSWKTTYKALELVKCCIGVHTFGSKLGDVIWNILLYDSTIHTVLWRILSGSKQEVEVFYGNSHSEVVTEDLQPVICCVFDVVHKILSLLPEEFLSKTQSLASTSVPSILKLMPLIAITASFFSVNNSVIQTHAIRVLSTWCFTASKLQLELPEDSTAVAVALQNGSIKGTLCHILDDKKDGDESLVVYVFDFLTSAANHQPTLLISLFTEKQSTEVPLIGHGKLKRLSVASFINKSRDCGSSLGDQILKYAESSNDLFISSPRLLLSVLNFLKALWEGGAQFTNVLGRIRSSKIFWDKLLACLSVKHDQSKIYNFDLSDAQLWSSRYCCWGMILNIMALELFLQDKSLPNNKAENINGTLKDPPGQSSELYLRDSIVGWLRSPAVENLIVSFSESEYKAEFICQAKVATCLFIVHLITKLSVGDTGSMSISLVRKIQDMSRRLFEHSAFSILVSQYSMHGYSDAMELTSLIISDLYYHIQGELVGRKISSGPFRELFSFLMDSEIFHNKGKKFMGSILAIEEMWMFDVPCILDDIGFDMWEHCHWKTSIEVADKMIRAMHNANFTISMTGSQFVALRALLDVFSVYDGTKSIESVSNGWISDMTAASAISSVFNSFRSTLDSAILATGANGVLFDFHSAQADLLLVLLKFGNIQCQEKNFAALISLIKMCIPGISFLVGIMPFSLSINKVVKSLLLLLSTLLKSTYSIEKSNDHMISVRDDVAEACHSFVGLLPVLCKFSERLEFSTLSLMSMDLILKCSANPTTCLQVLQNHLPLQAILQNFYNDSNAISSQAVLSFLLTLGSTKDGTKMLLSSNTFSFLISLFTRSIEQRESGNDHSSRSAAAQGNHVLFLLYALAIITLVIHFGDNDICADNVNKALNFLSEKAFLLSSCLSSSSLSVHERKMTRFPIFHGSLSTLRLAEHIITFMCVLAGDWAVRYVDIKGKDPELIETIMHMLAFISRGSGRGGEQLDKSSIFISPAIKEERELHDLPPTLCCKNGWFGFIDASATGNSANCGLSYSGLALIVRDPTEEDRQPSRTRFTETVAVQVYRLAFLILRFLSVQAQAAAQRAAELEFVDVAHFPDLPTPEVLHGLQDQAITIFTELCTENKSKSLDPETEKFCHLLLLILENSLFLELCVCKSCGITPVLGRMEDFSKQYKSLFQCLQQRPNFKSLLLTLNQIVSLLFPALQTNEQCDV